MSGRSQVGERLPAHLRQGECPHVAALRRQVHLPHLERKAGAPRPAPRRRPGRKTASRSVSSRGSNHAKLHPHLVGVARHVEQGELLRSEALELAVPVHLVRPLTERRSSRPAPTSRERPPSRSPGSPGSGRAARNRSWWPRRPGPRRPRLSSRPPWRRGAGPPARAPLNRSPAPQPADVGGIRIRERGEQPVEPHAEPQRARLRPSPRPAAARTAANC